MTNDYEGEDRDVRVALAQVLNEKRVRVVSHATRIRLLVVYALLIGLLAYVTTISVETQHGQKELIAQCHAAQDNARNFNALVDRIVHTYETSPVLTPSQRKTRVAFFAGAKQTVPQCPPLDRK